MTLGPPASAADGLLSVGEVLRVSVPEAFGGKTVIGQLTVDRAQASGFVTAFPCEGGLPGKDDGITRSDLNFDGTISPVASNRLIVEADDQGDVCFYSSSPAALIIDINAVSFDGGITSITNRRTDTRAARPRDRLVPAGGELRISVPEARLGRTVIGQLTVDRATTTGFITAYPCDAGVPRNDAGEIVKSDLNFDGDISPVASNRLIVDADDNGDICLHASAPVAVIVDINGIADTGFSAFTNRRTDTREDTSDRRVIGANRMLSVNIPEAVGGGTVLGQLTIDRATTTGFVTAYACADGVPRDHTGAITRSDLNFDGTITPVVSNRLIVTADEAGDVCLFTSAPIAIVVDASAIASAAAVTAFPNRRIDTRTPLSPPGPITPPGPEAVPVWPPYQPAPALAGVAALTGRPADASVTNRPILAVKIDNYARARPQFGLERADAVVELNVEGVTRFIALFHSRLPGELGPVRSARTGDLDLLAAMNRPVFGYSGANAGVIAWLRSAAASGVLLEYSAQNRPCYRREPTRPGPHNLLVDPTCALAASSTAGPAAPLWTIDPTWTVPVGVASAPDSTFAVAMDGVAIEWTWDARSRTYLRSQDGGHHLTASGQQLAARNVVEVFTDYVPSPVDNRSPVPVDVGTGSATVHRSGVAIRATWSRPSVYDRFAFFEPSTGLPILLDSGTTFLELTRSR